MDRVIPRFLDAEYFEHDLIVCESIEITLLNVVEDVVELSRQFCLSQKRFVPIYHLSAAGTNIAYSELSRSDDHIIAMF